MSISLSKHSIFSSPPFRFLIGSERQEFHLHSAAVARQSHSLGALVNGPMKEAKELCALIEDVDPQTFARFGHYIYTGTYHAAEHRVLLDTGVSDEYSNTHNPNQVRCNAEPDIHGGDVLEDSFIPPGEAVAEPTDPWDSFARKPKKKRFEKGRLLSSPPSPEDEPPYINRSTPQWKDFTALKYHVHPQIDISKARANTEPCEEYTETFLSHARIYVFADKYSISNLRQLALRRLHETLTVFTLYEERISDITCLLSFSYDNTPDRNESVDELRRLVVKFVCCHISRVHRDTRLVDMLKAQGSFSVDLLRELVK